MRISLKINCTALLLSSLTLTGCRHSITQLYALNSASTREVYKAVDYPPAPQPATVSPVAYTPRAAQAYGPSQFYDELLSGDDYYYDDGYPVFPSASNPNAYVAQAPAPSYYAQQQPLPPETKKVLRESYNRNLEAQKRALESRPTTPVYELRKPEPQKAVSQPLPMPLYTGGRSDDLDGLTPMFTHEQLMAAPLARKAKPVSVSRVTNSGGSSVKVGGAALNAFRQNQATKAINGTAG